jgi:hypothetical protein
VEGIEELKNRLLEFEYVNKEGVSAAFAMRAYAVRHFAQHDDGTAIIADTLGGFTHVTMRYDDLAEQMAEYDRFIEVRMFKVENGQMTPGSQRRSIRAQNIAWYGNHLEGGATIIDRFGNPVRVASTFDEIKRLLEGM